LVRLLQERLQKRNHRAVYKTRACDFLARLRRARGAGPASSGARRGYGTTDARGGIASNMVDRHQISRCCAGYAAMRFCSRYDRLRRLFAPRGAERVTGRRATRRSARPLSVLHPKACSQPARSSGVRGTETPAPRFGRVCLPTAAQRTGAYTRAVRFVGGGNEWMYVFLADPGERGDLRIVVPLKIRRRVPTSRAGLVERLSRRARSGSAFFPPGDMGFGHSRLGGIGNRIRPRPDSAGLFTPGPPGEGGCGSVDRMARGEPRTLRAWTDGPSGARRSAEAAS